MAKESTVDVLYPREFNWRRAAKVVIPVTAAAVGAGIALRYISGNETSSSKRIREPVPVVQDIRDNPIPEAYSGLRKSLNSHSSDKVNRDVALPNASGYTVSDDGWIKPDFNINKDYDTSNINDFALALVEANVKKDYDFARENLVMPGKRFTWGRPLGRSVEEYKIELYEDITLKPGRIAEEDMIDGARYHMLNILTHTKLFPGKDVNNPIYIAETEDGTGGKRFYVVGGI